MTKLIVEEPETAGLIQALHGETLLASDLVRTELRRAVARVGPEQLGAADAIIDRLRLVHLDAELLDAAGRLGPPAPRTLDSIHLQCALLLGEEIEALVTYDVRQAEAARAVGLEVWSPA